MDGIIFDVDGTIWNTTEIVARAWTRAIGENSDLDIVITETDLQNLFGKPMEEIYEIVFPNSTTEEKNRLAKACMEYEYAFLEKEQGKVYDGIIEVILALAKKYPLYIVSNCEKGYIELLLRTLKLEDYFVDFLCYGDTLKTKCYTISELMKKNNLRDVVYIGDTQGDMEACKKNDIPFIYAAYGFGDIEDVKWKVHQPGEIIDLIDILIHEETANSN